VPLAQFGLHEMMAFELVLRRTLGDTGVSHMIPISKDICVLGILVCDVGSEHLLPCHMVCASSINNPACAPECINLQGSLGTQLLLGPTRLVT
jgi:hypothetical protein